MKNKNITLEYYNKNASEFIEGTMKVDFSATQDIFLKSLKGKKILDFGCGSGRDTKCFLEAGYDVDAIDGSIELCKRASNYTGIKVREMQFHQLDEIDKFDGIWACASILHLSKVELKLVFQKMIKAMKQEGVIYTSFKYGNLEGIRNGRYFTDFTEETFINFVKDFGGVEIEKIWVTSDVRVGRGDERWLNILLRKVGSP